VSPYDRRRGFSRLGPGGEGRRRPTVRRHRVAQPRPDLVVDLGSGRHADSVLEECVHLAADSRRPPGSTPGRITPRFTHLAPDCSSPSNTEGVRCRDRVDRRQGSAVGEAGLDLADTCGLRSHEACRRSVSLTDNLSLKGGGFHAAGRSHHKEDRQDAITALRRWPART
jgi:hypothetical protein